VIVVIVALAVLIPLGRFMYIATPGGTGFAAKHLCSLVFVSGLDPERAMEIYVKPAIFPLASFLSYEVDRESRTIRTEIFETQSGADPNTAMLFLEPDGAGFSASRSPYAQPNTDFDYMSGCTVLASRLVREAVGGTLEDAYAFVHDQLFDPLGMTTAELEPAESGTFIGSSFMLAPARDWARFGQLYLQGGIWEDRRIVTEDWIDYVTTPTALSPQGQYGAGFWLNPRAAIWPGVPPDAYSAEGFQGQFTFIIPSHDLVVVRLGASRVASRAHEVAAGVIASLRERAP
jgi:CubicO group peptidase (beta-lactamase class C family)